MSKLDEIVREFDGLDFRERLELLLDFAESLPELPDELKAERDAGLHRVVECQTSVFLWVDRENGAVRIRADVAPEAPTVKGFVAVLVKALDGAPPEEVAAVPHDLLSRMGLAQALGMARLHGLNAIVARIKREARQASAPASGV